jgi:hypothetical protein
MHPRMEVIRKQEPPHAPQGCQKCSQPKDFGDSEKKPESASYHLDLIVTRW